MTQARITLVNDLYDLTTEQLIFSSTPDASDNKECYITLQIGDFVNPLDGTGGDFTLRTVIGNQQRPIETRTYDAVGRVFDDTRSFVCPANKTIQIYLTSPNAGDTNVRVRAELFDGKPRALPDNAPQTSEGLPLTADGGISLDTMETQINNLNSRITANLFAGITSLANWLGMLAGKTAHPGTLAEIQATYAGAAFDNTTDSLEAITDAAAAGGAGGWGEPPIVTDATDQSIWIRVFHKDTHLPAEDMTSSSDGLNLWYQRERGAKTDISPLSDLGTVSSSHFDGGLIHIDDGWYRLDPPDDAFSSGAAQVLFGGTADDYVIQGRLASLQTYNAASIISLLGLPDGYDTLAEQIAAIPTTGGGSAQSVLSGGLTGQVSTQDLIVYTGEAKVWTWTITDDAGSAIDLTGKTVKLIVETGNGTDLFTPITGVISGDSNNIVTVTTTAGDHTTAGRYFFALFNDTDDLVLARGKYHLIDLYGED